MSISFKHIKWHENKNLGYLFLCLKKVPNKVLCKVTYA